MGLANRKGGPLFPRVVSSREKIRHNCIFGTCNQESQDTEATAFVFVVICRLWVCLGLHGEQGLGNRVSESCFLPWIQAGVWGWACPADRGQQVAARNPGPLAPSSAPGTACVGFC